MALKWIERRDINIEKWEQCIDDALFPSLFGRYWFWDAMTDGKWMAVIDGEYDAVMPVYRKKKWGLVYISMPFLCQKIDIYHKHTFGSCSNDFYRFMIKNAIKAKLNTCQNEFVRAKLSARTNHILSLDKPYTLIRNNYNRNTKRNIYTSQKAGIKIDGESDVEALVAFIKTNDVTGLVRKFENQVRRLLYISKDSGKGFGMKATLHNEVISMGFFIEDKDRLYFLLCASNDIGKKCLAMYQLIDKVIQNFATRHLIFDFLGSYIDNIARRNIGFGAGKEQYYHVRWNIFGR